MLVRERSVELVHGDIDDAFYSRAASAKRVAWDIETSGLDWRTDTIGTCQIAVGESVAVVQLDRRPPHRLQALLENRDVIKVFHHAPFDLRFMVNHWRVKPASIACTKVASKILDPSLNSGEHSLKPVLSRELGIDVDKSLQASDWTHAHLTVDQLAYAATDVVFLERLLDHQVERASRAGLQTLLQDCFDFLPTRAQLDIRGSSDVFSY